MRVIFDLMVGSRALALHFHIGVDVLGRWTGGQWLAGVESPARTVGQEVESIVRPLEPLRSRKSTIMEINSSRCSRA